jgi:hypothetical protein
LSSPQYSTSVFEDATPHWNHCEISYGKSLTSVTLS